MSLEAVIADNTSAIRELIAALTASAKAPPAFDVGEPGKPAAFDLGKRADAPAAAAAAAAAAEARPTPAKNKATPPAPTPPTAAAPAADAPEQKAASSEPAPTTYNDVVAAVTKVAKAKGRDAAVAVFRDFGVDNGKELKPEQYAAVVAACAKAGAAE